jgi:hypothetical protein
MKINFCCLSKIKQKVKFVVSNPHSWIIVEDPMTFRNFLKNLLGVGLGFLSCL